MVKGDHAVTISFTLEPNEEARLVALALAKGLSPDALVREALNRVLAEAAAIPVSSVGESGAVLVAAMQASPYREIGIEPPRYRLPVREVSF
jgi:hypothetical protein